MKRGLILYVADGKEDLPDYPDLAEQQEQLNVDALRVATSDAEIIHYWWQLVTQGMQYVSCLVADYDAKQNSMQLHTRPWRLYG